MTTGNFWDTEVWSFIITDTMLLGAMMVANMLRRSIKPLRKMLIPSSVLGGFLLLIVNFIYKQIFNGESMFSAQMMEVITYHGLGLGFVAMSLRRVEKNSDQRLKSFDTGVAVVGGYLIQAVVGLVLSTALFYIMQKGFAASGLLLPMGYGQGPGQAYNWGRTYENLWGFDNGTSFGLTVAAMGFVAASVGGVIYLNLLRRKGRFSGSLGAEVTEAEDSKEAVTAKGEVTIPETFTSKKDLKDNYGMKGASAIGREWYEQLAALEEYAVGKTVAEITGMALTDKGAAAVEELTSSCTIACGAFFDSLEAAAKNAK